MTLRLSAIVGFFLVAAWGWGRMVRPFTDRRVFRFHSLTAILGLAVLNALGGLLNFAGLAKTPLLLALLVAGVLAATRDLLRAKPWRHVRFEPKMIPVFLAVGVAAIPALLLAPGGVFNIHDDFHTYATRAVRMAQTGSVGGNPFDPLGLDSLGSQSFFHAFFLAGHDIRLLNGFDAVACFMLCLMLVAEMSLLWRLPWWLGAAGVLGLAFVNPQYANISPLYSGVAVIMALVVCGALWGRTQLQGNSRNNGRIALTTGLLIALLLSLKVNLALYGTLYAVLLFVILLLRADNRPAVLRVAGRTVLVAALAMLPWMLVPIPALLEARHAGAELQSGAAPNAKYPALAAVDVSALFESAPLYYGNTPVAYLTLGLLGAVLALLGLKRHWKAPLTRDGAAMFSVVAAGIALLPAVLLAASLYPVDTAIRYSCPILIGGFFAAAFGFIRFGSSTYERRRTMIGICLTGCLAALSLVFFERALVRIEQAKRDQTLLSYAINRTFAAYSRAMVADEQTAYASRLQANMAPGATAFVWVVAPFHLDFVRNRLLTASETGVINPVLRFPAGASISEFAQYLRALGIRYVLLETNAYGVKKPNKLAALTRSLYAMDRKIGDYGTYLRSSLVLLAQQSDERYADDRMLLFELKNIPPG